MSDRAKTNDQAEQMREKANEGLVNAPDAVEARNVPKEKLDCALDQNPNKTKGMTELAYKDGFVDSPDRRSLELEAIDKNGNKITIDKHNVKTQREIRLESPPTHITSESDIKIQPNKKAYNEQISQSATLMAIEAEKNPALKAVALGRQHADSLPPGHPQKEPLTALSRELASKYSPEMRAHYEQFNGATHKALTPDNLTNTHEDWLAVAQKIAQLPIDKQLEVIGSGLLAGIQQYRHDDRERAWGQLIGTIQGTGEVLQGLAKIADFGAACILGDNERAGKMGEEFGRALGQTIVGGVRLFQSADRYLYKIGYTGDYGKPFRDIIAAGQKLDAQWSQLPPREQERTKAKLITEMIESGIIGVGGASAVHKASKFTEVLDALAVEAKQLHAAAKPTIKKAVKAINNAVDELIQPMSDTGVGVKMPVPKSSLKDESLLLSTADDLDNEYLRRPQGEMKHTPNIDKVQPTSRFLVELKQAIEGLDFEEREFLKGHNIEIRPVNRISDFLPNKERLGACYSPEHGAILVPDEISRLGSWIPNDDVPFALRHEFGHVLNAKESEQAILQWEIHI